MSTAAIEVKNVSKRYALGEVASVTGLWSALSKRNASNNSVATELDLAGSNIHADVSMVLPEAADQNGNATDPSHRTSVESSTELWALKNVSFEIPKGQVLGIVGRNGAGKSTLLKILSRITDPTEGSAIIRGRVGSLLEVGTGFHPELTGKENIFLNGSILGMSRKEIESRYASIIEFSEIGRFIDTPVKRYSSGMFTRLAFSVAANLEPEILILDEVLSVGDAAFQKKCLTKIHSLMRSGRTVIFVSHSLSSVAELCQSAILLNRGELLRAGPISEVLGAYSDLLNKDAPNAIIEHQRAGHGAILLGVSLENGTGRATSVFDLNDEVVIVVTFKVTETLHTLQTCLTISRNMSPVFNTFDTDGIADPLQTHEPGIYRSALRLPAHFLKAGSYSIKASLGTLSDNIVDIEGAASFMVEEMTENTRYRGYRMERLGDVICPGTWSVEQVAS